jgi:hypothetical protein
MMPTVTETLEQEEKRLTQKAAAKDVKELTHQLNSAIRSAAEQGLEVKLEQDSDFVCGQRYRSPRLLAKVSVEL